MATADDVCNVIVVQSGQGVHFRVKARKNLSSPHSETNHLDRNGSSKARDFAAAVDFPEASFTEEGFRLITCYFQRYRIRSA